jgi:hypothetical protein
MRRFALVTLVLGLTLVAACGGGDDVVEAGSGATSTTVPSTTSTGRAPTTTEATGVAVTGEIALTVNVVSQGAPLRDGTLVCDEGRVEGTGYLSDPAAAQAACDLLASNPSAVNLLVNGRQPGMMCTQQYGGPEVARVSGNIGDRRVSIKVDRTDGCGIAEWRMLTPLLGSPNT